MVLMGDTEGLGEEPVTFSLCEQAIQPGFQD
jgi:hypothetical protein